MYQPLLLLETLFPDGRRCSRIVQVYEGSPVCPPHQYSQKHFTFLVLWKKLFLQKNKEWKMRLEQAKVHSDLSLETVIE